MKHLYRQHSSGVLIFFFLACCWLPAMQVSAQREKTEPGKVRVKVSEELARTLETAAAAGRLGRTTPGAFRTGVQGVDQVGQHYKASAMVRVFRPAGKYEARHRRYGLHLWYEVTLDNEAAISQAVVAYRQAPHIQSAEPVYPRSQEGTGKKPAVAQRVTPGTLQNANDTYFAQQWHYVNKGQYGGTPGADINLAAAWKIETGSQDVIVAVNDGFVQVDHPDLAANMWVNPGEIAGNDIDDDNNGYIDDVHGFSFAESGGVATAMEHGTHVAGTIAAVTNNATGVAGVAGGNGTTPGVRLMTCGIFSPFGNAGYEEAFLYAADNGAVISQNSWSYDYTDSYNQSLLDAIDYFIAEAGKDEQGSQVGPIKGGLVVFAAGNTNYHGAYYPPYYSKVLAVGATSDRDLKASYSNYGKWVDIMAPGGDSVTAENPYRGIVSTLNNNAYGYLIGTSMACPHVSGVAALLISKYKGPGVTPDMIRARLTATADPIDALNPEYKGLLGAGRVNAGRALQPNDTQTPAAITDLQVVTAGMTSMTLSWTSPAAGSNASAAAYELRYATTPITASTIASATAVKDLPYPQASGITETYVLNGLVANETYYVAVLAKDFFGHTAPISNVVEQHTDEAPAATITPATFTAQLVTAETATQTLSLVNNGAGPLSFSVTAPAFVRLSITEGTVAANEARAIVVTLDAHRLLAGLYEEPITITTNQPGQETVIIPVSLEVTDNHAPLVQTTPDHITFGGVFAGATTRRDLVISNEGSLPLTITSVVSNRVILTVPFEGPVTLPAFETLTLPVTYGPVAIGTTTGTVSIHTDDPAQAITTVAVSATAIAAPNITVTPASLTQALTTGQTASRTITLRNTGGNDLTFDIGTSFDAVDSKPTRVLILTPDYDARIVEQLLDQLPHVQADVYQHFELPALKLSDLTPYDVIMIPNQGEWAYEGGVSSLLVGNLLADYVDQGGALILHGSVYDDTGWGLTGRLMEAGYSPLEKTEQYIHDFVQFEAGASHHPILDQLPTLEYYQGFVYDAPVTPGATVLAYWNNGMPMAAIKGRVVAFNFLAMANGQLGLSDGSAALYQNTLRYLTGATLVTAAPRQGIVAAGQQQTIDVTLNAAALAGGSYAGTLDIHTNIPSKATVTVPVALNVTGPEFTVSEPALAVTATDPETSVRTVTLTNTGSVDFDYVVSIKNQDIAATPIENSVAPAAARQPAGERMTLAALDAQGPRALGLENFAAGRQGYSANSTGTPLYATGFEEFDPTYMDYQHGWSGGSTYGLYTVETRLPASGAHYMQILSDGRGLSNIVSPFISSSGSSTKTTLVMDLDLSHGIGSSWLIFPQSMLQGQVITKFSVTTTGKAQALVRTGWGEYDYKLMDIQRAIPTGYFTLAIEVDSHTGEFDIYFDDDKVFSGTAFATTIENFALGSSMEMRGSYMNIDNVRILQGGREVLAHYLTVAPVKGSLRAGESAALQTTFTATSMPAGTYLADIELAAAGVTRQTVATSFTVTAPQALEMVAPLQNYSVYYKADTSTTFSLLNQGGTTLDYTLETTGFGEGIITFDPVTGSLPVRGRQEVDLYIDGRDLEPGVYSGTIRATLADGSTQEVQLSFRVMTPPAMAVAQQTYSVTATHNGAALKRNITLSNNGGSMLWYFVHDEKALDDATVIDPATTFAPENAGPFDGTAAILSGNQSAGNSRVYEDVYFHRYADASMHNQHGWASTASGWAMYRSDFEKHPFYASDGSGEPSVLHSPLVLPGDALVSSLAIDLGVSMEPEMIQQVVIQSVSEGKIVTRLQFGSGSVQALVRDAHGNAVFVPMDYSAVPGWEGLFLGGLSRLRVDVVRATGEFTVYVENIPVFRGQGFAHNVEQAAIVSSNAVAGWEMHVYTVRLGDGAPWLDKTWMPDRDRLDYLVPGNHYDQPFSILPIGLPSGDYAQTLVYTGNDPATPDLKVRVTLHVGGTPVLATSAKSVDYTLGKGQRATQQSVTLTNTGDMDLDFFIPGYGEQQQHDLPYNRTTMTLYYEDSYATRCGPDAHGYGWISSEDAEGPTHAWHDIAATGRKLWMNSTTIKNIELLFDFPFYEKTYNMVTVCGNGNLRFGLTSYPEFLRTEAIPDVNGANNIISPFGGLLIPDAQTEIYYQADDEKIVVQYTHSPTEYVASPHTYQVILYRDGRIQFVYKIVYAGYFSIIGIENEDGTDGIVAYGAIDAVKEDLTIEFIPTPHWAVPDVTEGTLAPGESRTINLALNTDGLNTGLYQGHLTVMTNQPDNPYRMLPISLAVGEVTGVEEDLPQRLTVYPVPAYESLYITLEENKTGEAVVVLLNAQGQVVYTQPVSLAALAQRYTLDLKTLEVPAGLYYLQVKLSDGTVYMRKVVREK